jgi:hypothetical protein
MWLCHTATIAQHITDLTSDWMVAGTAESIEHINEWMKLDYWQTKR